MNQLDEPGREQLRVSLMEHIYKFRHGPVVVRKQLCLAFSEYAGRFHSGKADIVQNVCTSLSQSEETVPVLLELLMLLGEEADQVQEKYQGVPPDEQHPLLISAWGAALGVLNFLHQCFDSHSKIADAAARTKSCKPIIGTFCRWLRFGAVTPDQLVQSPIVHAALSSLDNSELCESSSDLLCELAYVSRDLSTGGPVFTLLTSNLSRWVFSVAPLHSTPLPGTYAQPSCVEGPCLEPGQRQDSIARNSRFYRSLARVSAASDQFAVCRPPLPNVLHRCRF